MNALNDLMQEVASCLIGEFGTSQTAVVVTKGTYDAKTGLSTPDSEAETAIHVSPPAPYETSMINGTSVKRGDMMSLVPYDDITDELKNQIDLIKFTSGQLSGQSWTVVQVKAYFGGDEPAAWELQLRP